MSKQRICIFTETYHPVVGGGETQAKTLADGLAARGYAVSVLTRRTDASHPKFEEQNGVRIYRLPPIGRQHLKKWALLPLGFLALFRLRREYDLVFVSGFRVIGVAAILISRISGKSCILKADNNGEFSGDFFAAGMARYGLKQNGLLFRTVLDLRNRILRRADGFAAISDQIADELIQNGVPPANIARIPNSVDTVRFRPVSVSEKLSLRRQLGLPADELIVTFTGRLVSYKGLPVLLTAWKTFKEKDPAARLVLVGSGSLDIHNCEQDLRAFVRENAMTDQVIFAGEVENVQEFLQVSDLFVFPTEKEAFGISVIEAMACGLPVISSGVGGLSAIIRHQENGFLIEPRKPDQLLAALERLATTPALRAMLGDNARATAQAEYSDEVVIQKYLDQFRTARAPSQENWSQRARREGYPGQQVD